MAKKCPKCKLDNPGTATFCADCGTQLPSPEDIEVTETIEAPKEELTRGTTFAGRYEIIEELGKGGMGRVYRVEDKKLEQEVALKLIKPEIAKDKKTIERFRNELKLARNIRHKNVCGMFDLGEERGAHFITMEYVRGEDLRSSIRRFGQLPIGKSIAIAKQICEGLSEAHRLGVVHRDLKSNNIMIDKEGNVRIMDFGIARSLEAKGITGAGVMIGTPEYMSPEQVEGKEVDQRSDIYSLGVILYEMVTGRVPFEGDTPFTVGMKHKGEIPENPKELNSQISDELNRVILRCLEKEKEQRYQSAGEVRSQLENIEKGIPTTERVISERKPLTSREITVQFSLKKLLIPAIVIIAVVIIGLILWQVLPQEKAMTVPTDKPSLAVIYFINNTGDENLDHWRSALPEWLITDLSQSKYLRVLSGDRLLNILRKLNLLEAKSYDSDDLKKVAREAASSHILKGSFSKAGDIFRIDYALQNIGLEEPIGSDYVTGKGEESFPSMVDELTRKIKSNFQLSQDKITNDIDREVGMISTSSPEAYRYYNEGRKYHYTGEYRESIPFMQKAIEIDPSFAMAYRSMAMSYGNLGYSVEERKHLKKAFELTDRLSDRERYLIQGDFYRNEMIFDKAIEAYDKLLELYPDDHTGANNSAIVYLNLEDWDKAIERYKVAVGFGDPSIQSHIGLAGSYAAKGLYDKCEELLKSYLQDISESINIRRLLVRTQIIHRNYELAQAIADETSALFPNHYRSIEIQGSVYFYKGELLKAEEEFQKLLGIEYPMVQLDGRERLSALYLLQGRFKEAISQGEKGLELAKELGEIDNQAGFLLRLSYCFYRTGNHERALEELEKSWNIYVDFRDLPMQIFVAFAKGMCYVKMQAMGEAQRTADEIIKLVDQSMNRKLIRYYDNLVGRIELKRGNISKALEHLEKAEFLMRYQFTDYDDHAPLIDPLALVYFKEGDLDKARLEYEKLTHLTLGRTYYGDIYAKSFYMLGKIYEQQGDTAQAIEHYERFLDLWKDADPGNAEVEDARKRLAGLKGN